jgi:acyl carrier protein
MSATDDRIRTFIETKFKPKSSGRPFDDDTPLFSSGIVDSFGVLELIAFLEDAFKIDIDVNKFELRDFDTVRKVSGLVSTISGASGGH